MAARNSDLFDRIRDAGPNRISLHAGLERQYGERRRNVLCNVQLSGSVGLGGLAGWAKARGQVPKIFSRKLLGPILACALVGVGILWHKVSWHPYGWYAPLIYFALAVLIRSLILWTIESRGIVTWVFGNTADAGAWSAILWDIPLAFNRN